MYDFGVYKGNSRAIICGENWCRFVEDFDLREGDLVSFDLTEDIPMVYCCNLARTCDQNEERKDPLELVVKRRELILRSKRSVTYMTFWR